jgi:hypothetical protein
LRQWAEPRESPSSRCKKSKRFAKPSWTHSRCRSNSASATRKSAMAPCSLRSKPARMRDDSRAWFMHGSSHAFSRPPQTHGIGSLRDFALPVSIPARTAPRVPGDALRIQNPLHCATDEQDPKHRESRSSEFVTWWSLAVNPPIFPPAVPRTRAPRRVPPPAGSADRSSVPPAGEARTAPRSTSSGEAVRGSTAPRHTGPEPARFSAPLRAPRRGAPPAG